MLKAIQLLPTQNGTSPDRSRKQDTGDRENLLLWVLFFYPLEVNKMRPKAHPSGETLYKEKVESGLTHQEVADLHGLTLRQVHGRIHAYRGATAAPTIKDRPGPRSKKEKSLRQARKPRKPPRAVVLEVLNKIDQRIKGQALSTARLVLMVEQETCKYRYHKVATITGVPAPEIMRAHQKYLQELRKRNA